MDQSNPKNYLESEAAYFNAIGDYWEESSGSFSAKTNAFSRFVPRQALSYFLVRNDIFRQVLDVHGSVLDFGIYRGGSFFTWLQLSAIYEPYNHIRKVVGFDSFEGFSALGEHDKGAEGRGLALKSEGGMAYDGYDELVRGLDLYNLNRPLGHVAKGSIVKGELPASIADYLQQHEETIVSLANFGLGLYEPTVEILKLIKPRLVKGSVLLFEDLNQSNWPGETRALFEVFDNDDIVLKRSAFCPHLSWMQV